MNYNSAKWHRLREKILRRDGYMCQWSKRYGRIIKAETVHHIWPAEDYPEFEWCEWNLISLSNEAHNKMHNRESGRLSEEGNALRRRHPPYIV